MFLPYPPSPSFCCSFFVDDSSVGSTTESRRRCCRRRNRGAVCRTCDSVLSDLSTGNVVRENGTSFAGPCRRDRGRRVAGRGHLGLQLGRDDPCLGLAFPDLSAFLGLRLGDASDPGPEISTDSGFDVACLRFPSLFSKMFEIKKVISENFWK